MKWHGDRLKRLVSERDLTQEAFSKRVGVSRQAFAAWVREKVPKGLHLLSICRELGVPAEAFFEGADTKLAAAVGGLVRETTATYAGPMAAIVTATPERSRRLARAAVKADPFLLLLELADRGAGSLTNEQIDEAIYGR